MAQPQPKFRVRVCIIRDFRDWRNNLLLGLGDTIDGLVRLGTLGIVSSGVAISLLGRVTYRDIQRSIKREEDAKEASLGHCSAKAPCSWIHRQRKGP